MMVGKGFPHRFVLLFKVLYHSLYIALQLILFSLTAKCNNLFLVYEIIL